MFKFLQLLTMYCTETWCKSWIWKCILDEDEQWLGASWETRHVGINSVMDHCFLRELEAVLRDEESAVSNNRYFVDNANTTLQQSCHCLPSNWLETKKSLTVQFEWLHDKWIVRCLATFSNDSTWLYSTLILLQEHYTLASRWRTINVIIKWRRLAMRNWRNRASGLGRLFNCHPNGRFWRMIGDEWCILQMGTNKSANLTRLYANYKHLMRKWMHKLESSNNLTISQQFASISNYCTYLNLYKQVSLQNFFNYRG